MRLLAVAAILFSTFIPVFSQDNAKKIYDTERAFERAVAEKGINAGFIEFMSPVGVMFDPEPVNGRERWRKRSASPAALTWNPIKIEVSSNGALAFSIGNSIYRPKGKDDPNEIHGHYISIWTRQPDGEYLAALDTGINHEKPASLEPNWQPGSTPSPEPNPKNLIAGDSTIAFFRMAESRGLAKAFAAHAADDVYLLRNGKFPLVGRKAAIDYLSDSKLGIRFAKRRSFIEAQDLAYVYSTYVMLDKNGAEKEKGNFVQVWKLRGGRWQIAADVFIVIPPPNN